MGLICSTIEFDYPAPNEELLLARISDISGLPVIKVKSNDEDLYSFNIFIIFESFPNCELQVYAYAPGAIDKMLENERIEGDPHPNWPMPLEGSEEAKGKQNVYLKGYVGQELTLFRATWEALESLGGIRVKEKSESEDEYRFPITMEELAKRHKDQKKQLNKFWLRILLLLPVMIPIYFVKSIYALIKIPSEIRKAEKSVKDKYGKDYDNL